MTESVHDQITSAYGNEEPTIGQASYLVGLWKDTIKNRILKKHSALQEAKTNDIPFFVMFRSGSRKPNPGSFAIHFQTSFTVAQKMNRGAVSKLIVDARNGIIDVKLVNKFIDSANAYRVSKAKSKSS